MSSSPISVAPNFRDVGGMPTEDGRRVREGLLFRSEALLCPTETDALALEGQGIKLVCDLRSAGERERAPNACWRERGVEILQLDLLAGIDRARDPWTFLVSSPNVEGARAAMRAVYGAIPHAAASEVVDLVRRLADGAVPALIHCTAGKDRTGFVTAVILSLLGVTREAIFADYGLSQGRRTEAAAAATRELILERAGRTLPADAFDAIMGVDASYLEASLDAIARADGDVFAYASRAGLTEAALRRLRDRFLD